MASVMRLDDEVQDSGVMAGIAALAEDVRRRYPVMTEAQRERLERQVRLLMRALTDTAGACPWYCLDCDRWHTAGVRVCECGARNPI